MYLRLDGLLVDDFLTKGTRKTISVVQGRCSSVSALGELIVDGSRVHCAKDMISGT